MTGMLSCMLVLSVSSCVKDDFDRYHDVSDALSFKVEVSDGWSAAASASSTTSIRRMSQSTDAEPLYLVTKVSDSAPVSAVSGVVTRGTPVENATTLETGGFGLSAICYTGTWPAEGSTNSWTTNFAHNLNVTMQGGQWKAPGKLEWPGSGNIKFFAYYPYSGNSDGSIAHSDADAKGAPVLTYTVPNDVKNQPDLLWAVADHSGKSTGYGSVALNFQHALTAVTIKTGTDMLSGTITGVKISGVYGQGSCRIGGTAWTTQGSTGDFEIKDLIVKLSKKTDENGIGINTEPGATVTDGELTFMMIPQTLPAGAKLTINFTDELTTTDRTLTADIGGTSWPSGKKVAYSINSSGIVIETKFEFSKNPDDHIMPYSGVWYDATYTAEVEVTQVGVETKTIDIPAENVKLQYKFDGDESWVDCTTEAGGLLTIAPQDAYTTMRNKFTEKGIDTDNEIEMFSLSGEYKETANCYLVDKAGYYSLDLVYGNGNVSDPVNTTQGLKYYPKHDDGRMPADGKISGVSDAVLCWQDAPDLIDPASVKVDKGNLVFHIRKQTLTQGNALLAVRNSNKDIIWSWHIWVTPYKSDFYNQFYASKPDNTYSYDLAKYNLGWCERHEHNASRTFSLQAVVDMSAYGGKEETLIEIGTFIQDVFKGSDAGDNTYYQWGRKDPMLGGIYNAYTKKYQYNKKGGAPDKFELTMENKQVFNQYNQEGYNYSFCKNPGDMIEPYVSYGQSPGEASRGVTIGYAIQHPYMFVTNSSENETDGVFNYRNHWHIPYADYEVPYLNKETHIMFNAWNSAATDAGYLYSSTGTLANNAAIVTKSVYDPCPPEFQMPPIHALKAVYDKTLSTSASYVDNAWTIKSGGESITFPMTGVRNNALRSSDWDTVVQLNSDEAPDETFCKDFYKTSMPAFSMLTFLSSATIVEKGVNDAYQVYLIGIDRSIRANPPGTGNLKRTLTASSNSYGLSVRPMHYTAGK